MSFVVVFLFGLLLDCCVAVSPFSRPLFHRQAAGRTVSPPKEENRCVFIDSFKCKNNQLNQQFHKLVHLY